MEEGPVIHRAQEAATGKQQARDKDTPMVRPGVYVRPLPLTRSALSPECWWLRSQPWCEEHLQRLAGAWERMYGKEAA
jgi:hypothetical protein